MLSRWIHSILLVFVSGHTGLLPWNGMQVDNFISSLATMLPSGQSHEPKYLCVQKDQSYTLHATTLHGNPFYCRSLVLQLSNYLYSLTIAIEDLIRYTDHVTTYDLVRLTLRWMLTNHTDSYCLLVQLDIWSAQVTMRVWEEYLLVNCLTPVNIFSHILLCMPTS